MEIKLFDSEYKLMEIVWSNEPISAKEVSLLAAEEIGWNKNTTYTIIKKLIDKNVVLRTEPNFICTSLVKRDDIVKAETNQLIQRLFHGSKKAFFSAFIQDETLSKKDYEELKKLLEEHKK